MTSLKLKLKLSILLRFYFHDVLELKADFHANFRFDEGFEIVEKA